MQEKEADEFPFGDRGQSGQLDVDLPLLLACAKQEVLRCECR